jgi:hypothetical protein
MRPTLDLKVATVNQLQLHATLRDFVRPSATFRDFGLRRCATLPKTLLMITSKTFQFT